MAIGSECVGHYLIWRMGIAHNDISLSNLMCTERNGHDVGVLNDFDLATVMEPGSRYPEKKGWERTGSIPFLAMDLLKYPDGTQKRWYRHDLESFMWCLLWVMMEHPPLSWLDNGFKEVYDLKIVFCVQAKRSFSNIWLVWKFARLFAVKWIRRLDDGAPVATEDGLDALFDSDGNEASDSSDVEARNAAETEKKDSDHVRVVAESAKKMKGSTDIPALDDTSWVDVELEGLKK